MQLVQSICVLVLAACVWQANAQKSCPNALVTEADEAFSKVVLYGDRSFRWGTTNEQVDKTCKSVKTADKRVRKYLKNCLSGLSQQVIGLILKGAVSQVKRFCTSSNRNVEAFKHVKCGNANIEKDHACMHTFVNRLKDASSNLPDELKLSSSCCSFIQFENCILHRMEKEARCTKDDITHFKSIVHGVAGDALDLSCSEYFNGDPSKCDDLNNKLKKVKKSNMKGKSILLPMVELIKKIA